MRQKSFNHWVTLDYGFAEILGDIRGMIVFSQIVSYLGTLATPKE